MKVLSLPIVTSQTRLLNSLLREPCASPEIQEDVEDQKGLEDAIEDLEERRKHPHALGVLLRTPFVTVAGEAGAEGDTQRGTNDVEENSTH